MNTATPNEVINVPHVCDLAKRFNALLAGETGEDNLVRLLLDLKSAEETLRARGPMIPFLTERVSRLREAKERIDGAFPSVNFRDPSDEVSEANDFPEEDDNDLLIQVEDALVFGDHDFAFGLRKEIEARVMALRLELDERVGQERGLARIERLKAEVTALMAPPTLG